ncbi:MAG: cytosine deaminase [Rhodospirillaceae bacterium]|nr:MAG: cytosine deaminase [Rhodospirillaceae bacterium]
MTGDLLIRAPQLSDGRRVDIVIEAGRIAALAAAGKATVAAGTAVIEAVDSIALPAFVDSHLHLDKTFWGQPWISNRGGPTRRQYIAHEQEVLPLLPTSTEERATALLKHLQSLGTLYLRSHVDISPEFGLRHMEAMLRVREACAEDALQLVAFPQTGLLSRPGTLELMEEAMRLGADVVGGIDPAGFDNDPMGHLRAIFALAEHSGKPIDLHLHDPGELGGWEIERIIHMTAAAGLAGRVMISHAYCLGALPEAQVARIAGKLAELHISLMTAAPGWTSAPPVELLRQHGVVICSGSDGIRDAWSPFGSGDMLGRGNAIAERFGWATDAELRIALDVITQGGASAMKLKDYGIEPGCRADLVLLPVERPEEALTIPAIARKVISRGRLLD